jgi:peptidoglycan hydrolase CwlO-like protein
MIESSEQTLARFQKEKAYLAAECDRLAAESNHLQAKLAEARLLSAECDRLAAESNHLQAKLAEARLLSVELQSKLDHYNTDP